MRRKRGRISRIGGKRDEEVKVKRKEEGMRREGRRISKMGGSCFSCCHLPLSAALVSVSSPDGQFRDVYAWYEDSF